MAQIEIDDALDRQLEAELPPRLRGERKKRQRFEHVAEEWLRGKGIAPRTGEHVDKRSKRDAPSAVAAG